MSIFNDTYGTSTKTDVLKTLESALVGDFSIEEKSVIDKLFSSEFDSEVVFTWKNSGYVTILFSIENKKNIGVTIGFDDEPQDLSDLRESHTAIVEFVENLS